MMRTSNPAFSSSIYKANNSCANSTPMTVAGTVNKTAILLTLLLATAAWVWSQFTAGVNVSGFLWGGLIGGLIVAMITVFKQEWAPYTAPAYALLEGCVLGGLSAMFEKMYPGIVAQAVFLTLGVFAAMLFMYRSKIIVASEKFKAGIFAATAGIGIAYFASFILGMFGVPIPIIHDSSLLGIGFSLFVVIIAAMNLILDFDYIEQGAKAGLPSHMEWYGAFGLMVTLIWLYIEILRLLAKLNDRR